MYVCVLWSENIIIIIIIITELAIFFIKKKTPLKELNGFGASWQVNPSNGGSGMGP